MDASPKGGWSIKRIRKAEVFPFIEFDFCCRLWCLISDFWFLISDFCCRLWCQSWRCWPTLVNTPTSSTFWEPSHLGLSHVTSSTCKTMMTILFFSGELYLIVEYCRFGNLQKWAVNFDPQPSPFHFARLITSKRASFISQINPLSGRYDESHPPDLEERLHSHR